MLFCRVFFLICIRNRGVTERYFGLKRDLLCTPPKNGRILLLGKKHTVLGEKMSQEGDHQKKEMPDFERYRLALVVFWI